MGGAGCVARQAGVGAGSCPGLDQAGEEKAPLEFTDGRRNVGRIEVAIALDLVLVEGAQDADARQKPGAARLAEKHIAQRGLGAAGRQEDAPMRQLGGSRGRAVGFRKTAGQHGPRECGEKRHVGRDGEDAHGLSAARTLTAVMAGGVSAIQSFWRAIHRVEREERMANSPSPPWGGGASPSRRPVSRRRSACR
jgi:hypothetical protein